MPDSRQRPQAVRNVQAHRISTGAHGPRVVEEEVGVVLEDLVTIDVERLELYTLLCMPHERRALVAGFLLSEGLIDSMEDVASLEPCDVEPDVIRVRLNRAVPSVGDPGRNLLITSSCGACGGDNLRAKLEALPRVGDQLVLEAGVLRATIGCVRELQTLFDRCGGTHAAGIFDAAGEVVTCAEDTGRHNALDKAIGKCLLAGVPTAGRGVVLTGRVSMEMVGKCARAGIELISAVSAPTSLAVEVARRCNITLCAFVRQSRATVFTHPRRVRGLG
jgi:FdhD protein